MRGEPSYCRGQQVSRVTPPPPLFSAHRPPPYSSCPNKCPPPGPPNRHPYMRPSHVPCCPSSPFTATCAEIRTLLATLATPPPLDPLPPPTRTRAPGRDAGDLRGCTVLRRGGPQYGPVARPLRLRPPRPGGAPSVLGNGGGLVVRGAESQSFGGRWHQLPDRKVSPALLGKRFDSLQTVR